MMREQPQEVARERVERPVKSFRALKKPIWAGREQTRVSVCRADGRQVRGRAQRFHSRGKGPSTPQVGKGGALVCVCVCEWADG